MRSPSQPRVLQTKLQTPILVSNSSKHSSRRSRIAANKLEAGAKQAELGAIQRGSRAALVILLICATSFLMMSIGSFALVRRITRSLNRLIHMIQDIAEGEGDVTRRLEVAGGFGDDEMGKSAVFSIFSWINSK